MLPISRVLSTNPTFRKKVLNEFQLNLYSQTGKLEKDGDKILLVLEKVYPQAMIFEIQTPFDTNEKSYLNHPLEVSEIYERWNDLFPSDEDQPNLFIDGFEGDERKIGTFTPSSKPEWNGQDLIFETVPDAVATRIRPGGGVSEWDGASTISHVSLLIDGLSIS